jgi:hypothetical protein
MTPSHAVQELLSVRRWSESDARVHRSPKALCAKSTGEICSVFAEAFGVRRVLASLLRFMILKVGICLDLAIWELELSEKSICD